MSDEARTSAKPKSREDRLKAALKANMGRRKAQARMRTAAGEPEPQVARDETETGGATSEQKE